VVAVTRPLAIDLYCGLRQAEFFPRADSAIKEFVACGADDPDHMSLRIGDDSPCPISLEFGPVSNFKDAGFAACLARIRQVRISTSKSTDDRILKRSFAQLVLQDVLTLHGSQFRGATLIVASPPCQAYSYRAMPWKRAKALPPPDNTLFEACFRIQREACEAAGRHIPLIVENVRGAQKWVGRARWNYGSFYLWGDVPALMPLWRCCWCHRLAQSHHAPSCRRGFSARGRGIVEVSQREAPLWPRRSRRRP
jgi:hypothetical protein